MYSSFFLLLPFYNYTYFSLSFFIIFSLLISLNPLFLPPLWVLRLAFLPSLSLSPFLPPAFLSYFHTRFLFPRGATAVSWFPLGESTTLRPKTKHGRRWCVWLVVRPDNPSGIRRLESIRTRTNRMMELIEPETEN